ncbi:MAG TPA: thioesterase family protein [Cyclobacteriaceae bacterium]|nr:thioesterase family protein [Cyclobacteriaceae bacterium]
MRLSLEIPEKFIYKTELVVRASDLNYGGHVGNDNVLTLMQEARILFYNHIGFKDEIHFEGNVGQIISDALVIYKSESFLGDRLAIQIGVTDFNKYGFDLIYLITNQTTGKEAARGKTGIVCFDYVKRKVASVPHRLLQQLQR